MPLADDYAGPFDPSFRLERLSRAALARLARETMLFGHLHDRGIMPLVGSRFGPERMTDVACDEWIGSSPIYNRRNRAQLAIPGNGVSAILKSFQLDIGFPHEYMDVHYELVDETLGYFWLPFCGAFEDVNRISRGAEAAIRQLCHHMEDTTFDATVMAANPRARCLPDHRPPLQIGHSGPTCRWRVAIVEQAEVVAELPSTREIAKTRAARFAFAEPPDDGGGGMRDYAGPFRPDFRLEDFAQPVLARQCREFALDVHLLMRAAFRAIAQRWGGDAARELAREHWAAVAPVSVPRIRAALGIEGDDMASILKTLQVDPALPGEYVRTRCELVDARRGRFAIEPCDAYAPGEPAAWLALLEDGETPGFEPVLAAVNPRARCRPAGELAWELTIDERAEPRPESPMAGAVRASNTAAFTFRRGAVLEK